MPIDPESGLFEYDPVLERLRAKRDLDEQSKHKEKSRIKLIAWLIALAAPALFLVASMQPLGHAGLGGTLVFFIVLLPLAFISVFVLRFIVGLVLKVIVSRKTNRVTRTVFISVSVVAVAIYALYVGVMLFGKDSAVVEKVEHIDEYVEYFEQHKDEFESQRPIDNSFYYINHSSESSGFLQVDFRWLSEDGDRTGYSGKYTYIYRLDEHWSIVIKYFPAA